MPQQELVIKIIQWLYVVTAIGIVFVVISENRNPLKTISWVLILLFLPVVGIIGYYFFGRDSRHIRIISKRAYRLLLKQTYSKLTSQSYTESIQDYHMLTKLLNRNNGASLLPGSKLKLFTSGEEKFKALLEDIKNAKHHIHLQYYLFKDDEIGRTIGKALIEKAKEGIQVRVLYDDAANWNVKSKFYKEMRKAGVEITPFLKVHFPILTSKVNYRNHKKIVVIDGKIGYIGGMNIADRYLDKNKWRDTHLRIEGRGVLGLQSAFLIDWNSSKKPLLIDEVYFPKLPIMNDNLIQIVTGGPIGKWRNLLQATVHIISNAKRYVYIQTPYFLPEESLTQSILSAALSGVDIRLMIPAKSDVKFVDTASHSYFDDLIAAGVRIYAMFPAFIHSKTIAVDNSLSVIGSANMDFRSFEHNFEVNAYIYDKEFTRKMKLIFYNDQKRCIRIDPKKWIRRPRVEKFKESFLRMFSPLL